MDITPPNLVALYTTYNQVFQEAFLKQEIIWPKLCTLVNSKGKFMTHAWVDRIPQLRLWVGDRVVNGASLRDYLLYNYPFELTEGLDQFDIEDNQIQAFEPVVRMMAEQAKKWPDTLLFGTTQQTGPNGPVGAVLAGGQNVLTYDGVGYFSASHPINVDVPSLGVQSNYYASGKALTHTNFNTVRSAMRALKGADGLPLKVNPNLLIVPPALEAAAIQILKDELIAPTSAFGAGAANTVQSNPLKGTADYLVVDDLAGQDTTWYLMDTRSAIKPFIMQVRTPAKFVMRTRPDDPAIFERHEVQYGCDVRGNVGYGPWFLCAKAAA